VTEQVARFAGLTGQTHLQPNGVVLYWSGVAQQWLTWEQAWKAYQRKGT